LGCRKVRRKNAAHNLPALAPKLGVHHLPNLM
jgi:hypothetical protein